MNARCRKFAWCWMALAAHVLSSQVCAADDVVISSFDPGTYGDWKATGTAFEKGPASGDLITKLEIENAVGTGVASSEIEGDGPTGTLVSPAFNIQRPYISFLIGGGNYELHTCLNLLVGGKVVRSATGWNSDRLVHASWDVRPWVGKQAQIQLVDEASGSWGHINVDHIVQTDHPTRLPLNSQPLYQETHRPQFHFTARQWTMDRLNPGMRQEGWLNDLNGLIFYQGEYHLFAQRWNKCWIHAVSKDLVRWTELEPAFWEEQLDTGVQSGTCVVDYANTSGLAADTNHPALVAFWSRNDNRSQCISYSLDRGRSWKNHENNPVLIHPERDPKVFWHAPTARWVMFLYGEQNKERLYHIFTSTNLLAWRDEKKPIRNSYECPDFFQLPLDGDRNRMKWVLVRGDGKYSIGDFNGFQFSEETPQFDSDAGPNFYATQTWEDTPGGRRVQAAWMRGGTYPDMSFNQQITFPRELTLRATPEGPRLFRQPIRELETLHDAEQVWTNRTLNAGRTLPLAPAGDLFRLQAELTMDEGATLTMNVRGTRISFTPGSMTCGSKPVTLQTTLKNFEALVDRTSVETFANDGEASMSKCFLPAESGLSLRTAGGRIIITRLKLVSLRSAWK
ncbi:MAG TPA: glycoside hydrolase family 32 protein [Verrucomicrobiae bacterium]|nr:glycoside hydrolase family 32 protein [Verrucomicrobiae bacterium]